MTHSAEVVVDQAHRGYTQASDGGGFASINPLYMAYAPGPDKNFAGEN